MYINDKIECMFTVDVENGLEGSYFLSKTHIFSFPISFSPCFFCNLWFSTVLGVQMGTRIFLEKKKKKS